MSQEKPTFTERIEVTGDQLVGKIKELMADAGARSVVIRDRSGKQLMRVPLAVGVAGGAFALLTAPFLATVTAIGATVARVHLEVERNDRNGPTDTDR